MYYIIHSFICQINFKNDTTFKKYSIVSLIHFKAKYTICHTDQYEIYFLRIIAGPKSKGKEQKYPCLSLTIQL